MAYTIDNTCSIPEAITTVTDFILPDYVYGRVESESGDPFFGLFAKFFDDATCTIPSNLEDCSLTLEYSAGVNNWRIQPIGGISASLYTIRCGIPYNTITNNQSSRILYVRIKGWRIPNSIGLESIESYVKVVGKIIINPSSSIRRITITWL
jgi:hypothetical protein